MVSNPWGRGRTHLGFTDLCSSVRLSPQNGVGPQLEDMVVQSRLTLAGHSLWGAVSRLLSMRLKSVANIMTWGEPKSCGTNAAAAALSCFGTARRAINPRDVVPMLPEYIPIFFPYTHIGNPLKLTPFGDDLESWHEMDDYVAAEEALVPA